ncbi:MAG TPA: sterol carrier protein domain-containing protein, partial [Polyangiaceae bacterium]|nr:sterol carrier protein domain-containing protein [Polyangiaceae bacterium]
HDFLTTTAAALRRFTAFFAEHRSTIKWLSLRSSALDPLVFTAPERVFRIELSETWMLRVLDVEGALVARGYPPIDAAIDFELSDRTLPENSGRYRLAVTGGRAEVTPGGRGDVALDERALAALYTGFLSPVALAAAGRIEGEPTALARLGALFAGPPPVMPDYF